MTTRKPASATPEPKREKPCPNCGHCPTCGRSDRQQAIPYIPVPYPVPVQPYVSPYWVRPYRGPFWVGNATTYSDNVNWTTGAPTTTVNVPSVFC